MTSCGWPADHICNVFAVANVASIKLHSVIVSFFFDGITAAIAFQSVVDPASGQNHLGIQPRGYCAMPQSDEPDPFGPGSLQSGIFSAPQLHLRTFSSVH